MKGIHLHNTEVRREEEAKRINEKQVKRQDGRGTLCLRVSPNSKLSLKKSGNTPAKILCRLKLLHLKVRIAYFKEGISPCCMWKGAKNNGENKRKSWAESFWPDPQSYCPGHCDEGQQPKARGQISVSPSWCWLGLKTII